MTKSKIIPNKKIFGKSPWWNGHLKKGSCGNEEKNDKLRPNKGTITPQLVEDNADIIDWEYISEYGPIEIFSKEFCEKFKEEINWEAIEQRGTDLKENKIEELIGFLDMKSYYMSYRPYSEKFLRKHKDKINLNLSLQVSNVSERFLRDFQNEIDFNFLNYFTLSEKFIEDFQYKLNWISVSINSTFTEDMLEKYKDKIDWKNFLKNKILSRELIFKYSEYILESITKEHEKDFELFGNDSFVYLT